MCAHRGGGRPRAHRRRFMSRFSQSSRIVSSFGVGYDHIDAKWAGEHGIMITNTPDVLNEEVADTALGLLPALCGTAAGRRYLRAGTGRSTRLPAHPLDARPQGRHRRHGRIGKAIARRLEAMKVPVVYTRAGGRRALPALSKPGRDGARR